MDLKKVWQEQSLSTEEGTICVKTTSPSIVLQICTDYAKNGIQIELVRSCASHETLGIKTNSSSSLCNDIIVITDDTIEKKRLKEQ